MAKRDESLCWTCIRSGAPDGLNCIWDESIAKIPVDGSDTEWRLVSGCSEEIIVGFVKSCPLYMETNYKTLKILKEARKCGKRASTKTESSQ